MDQIDQVGQFNMPKWLATKNTLNQNMICIKTLQIKTYKDFQYFLQIMVMLKGIHVSEESCI